MESTGTLATIGMIGMPGGTSSCGASGDASGACSQGDGEGGVGCDP
jgi:hypothetical protein